MSDRITDLSFDDWILFVFCWPDNGYGSIGGNRGHHAEWWDPPPAVRVEYLTRLFENPVAALTDYSDGEIAQGLWEIAGDGDYAAVLADLTAPLSDRRRCVDTLPNLFRELFVPRCTQHLEHRSETGNPLNTICYMWWDLFNFCPLPEERAVLIEAVVRSLTTILHLPSMACQEAALHGLGHWLEADTDTIRHTIDVWLQHHPELRPELRDYALSAHCGCVL